MKKFISALSSLVIAATALGGTSAMPATAAINGKVDSTIIDIQSNGKNEITAKAGDKIPYTIYVPQSSGFYLTSLKFAVNGEATKGQDPAECGGVTSYTLTRDSQLGKKGETITHPEIFGNYGIQMSMSFCNPCCFVSGYLKENSMQAGKAKSQTGIASGENWQATYVSQGYLDKGVNLDSFNKFHAEGGDQDMEDEAAEAAVYASFEAANTWTKDEKWAYDYGLVTGEFTLPTTLKDGVYVIDVYTGEFITSQFLEDFKSESKDEQGKTIYVDDPENGKFPYTHSMMTNVAGESVKFETIPLTIKVGDVQDTTTTTTGTTTTKTGTTTSKDNGTTTSTTKQTSVDPGDKILYDLVPATGDYTFDGTNNVVNVAKGDTVKVNWTVQNDAAEVGGMEYTLDISQVASVANAKQGKAYDADALVNTDNAGEIVFTFSTMEILSAKNGAVVMSMDVTVPDKDGDYTIGIKTGEGNRAITAGHDVGVSHDYIFHGITFHVGEAGTTSSTTATTTTKDNGTTTSTTKQSSVDPGDKILYDLVPATGDYTFDGTNNVVNVAKGDTVKVNWTVKNDADEVGGMEYTLDISQVASVANAKQGKAYDADALVNTDNAGEIVFTFSTMEILSAKDGAVVMSMDVTVPDKDGDYTISIKTGEGNRAITAGHDVGVSHDYIFHGITFHVGDVETTTSTTGTTTTASTTTASTTTSTNTTTSSTTTSTTTSSTIPDGEVFWGDSNCDKKVSIADVVLLNRHLAGTATLSAQGAKNADVVFNNKLEPNDSKVIKGYLGLFIEYKVLGTADSEKTLDAEIAKQK